MSQRFLPAIQHEYLAKQLLRVYDSGLGSGIGIQRER